ncbi:ParA family protein [gamma proteobacterium HdN1]|nr:ParA family protein [gamma proteobacterium HdN1]
MRVWTIANQKGGVGKTTTTVTLGGLLAHAGHRVLLVDLDPHGSLTSYFNVNPDELEPSSFLLFQNKGEVPANLPGQLIQSTGQPRLDFIGASTGLAVLERQSASAGGMGLVLKRTTQILARDYDYILVDTPPILGVLLVNSIAACERIIIPVQTEFLALKGLERMLRTLAMVKLSQRREVPYLIVPTLFDRRTHASTQSLRILRTTYDQHLWAGVIAVDTRLRDASRAGVPPHVFDPLSRGVQQYASLLNYLHRSALPEQQREATLL